LEISFTEGNGLEYLDNLTDISSAFIDMKNLNKQVPPLDVVNRAGRLNNNSKCVHMSSNISEDKLSLVITSLGEYKDINDEISIK